MTRTFLRMVWRQYKSGNNKPLKMLARNAWHGLTHWRCFRCGRLKGPTTRKSCRPCGNSNLLNAIFRQEYP